MEKNYTGLTMRLMNSFRSLTLVLFVFLSFKALGQGEANVWIGPTMVGLNFNAGSPTGFVTGTARGIIDASNYEGEGCSSIADAAGNLLFYTEGVNVYNRNHVVMGNGAGLRGNLSSTQSAVIVPCPANPTRFYYIFCAPPEEASASPTGGSSTSSDGITYSIVDMTLNGGLGGVTATKNVRVTPAGENATEGLTVVPNFAGTGFWVIAHQAGTKGATTAFNKFYIYGVTTAGITAATGVINTWNNQSANVGTSIPGVVSPASGNGQVMIKSNSCFNKLAMTFFAKNSLIELYNFNNNTGAISLANSITNVVNNQVYGIEFSPNGDYLYVTILETNHRLYQFDISSGVNATINAARTEWTPTGTASLRWGQLQLGPDGRIYMSHHVNWAAIGNGAPHASIGVINAPNTGGAGANFVQHQITSTTLTNTGTKHGLPQFYKGFVAGTLDFGDDLVSVGADKIVCKGVSTTFNLEFTGTLSGDADAVTWDFGDGSPTTNVHNPSHTYSPATTPTTYTVTLTVKDQCDNEFVQTRTVRVMEVIPAGNVSCSSPSITLNGTGTGQNNYVWYDAVGGPTIGYGATVTKTYTPMSSTPSTFYVFDATPASGPYTVGNTTPTNGWSSGTLLTNFTLSYKSILTSVKVQGANNNPSVVFSIRQGATTIISLPAMAVAPSQIVTLNFNTVLPAGSYSIVASAGSSLSWSGVTGSARDIPGIVTVSGDGGGINSGPFYDLVLSVVNPCSNILTVNRSCVLPVEYVSFEAESIEPDVLLKWITASEENNKYFSLERSLDGIHFDEFATTDGSGNSNSMKQYSFIDKNAPAGRLYYRIKQVDIDGQFSYSAIRSVYNESTISISIQPNPSNGIFTIKLSGLHEDSELILLDPLGQIVFSKTLSSSAVSEEVSITLSHLSKGVYYLKAGNNAAKVIVE